MIVDRLRGACVAMTIVLAVVSPSVWANPADLSAIWRINGNGYPGELIVRQAADGSLSGSIYGDPLSGHHAPGERVAVLLRGPLGRPLQAMVVEVSADGMAIGGRLFALNAINAGASPARNVFGFSGQRAAAAPPGAPALPVSGVGPASIAGSHAIIGNGQPGALALTQAPDGSLNGTVYGQPMDGHYASGTGSVALMRYAAPGQPMQLYVGSATPQGLSGEFYALTTGGGASLQRMRFAWSATSPAAAQTPPTVLARGIAGTDLRVLPPPTRPLPPGSIGAAPPPPPPAPPATPPQLPAGTLLAKPPLKPVRVVPGLTVITQPACGASFSDPCAEATNPASAKLSWGARADATHYRVVRGADWLVTVTADIREYVDETLAPGTTAQYAIEALRQTGNIPVGAVAIRGSTGRGNEPVGNTATLQRFDTPETSARKTVTTPVLEAPRNLTAQSIAGPKGRVRLSWTPVAGANGYLVYRDGNPLPVDPASATRHGFEDTQVPLGQHRYIVEALFTTPATQRRVNSVGSSPALVDVAFPRPRTLFLTQPAGHGSIDSADAHARTRCGNLFVALPDCPLADFLRMGTNWEEIWQDRWGDRGLTMNWAQAVFANTLDLDAGRRVNCVPRRGNVTLCWASSHHTTGSGSQVGAAADFSLARSINVILLDGDRAFFGSWSYSGHITHYVPPYSIQSGGKTVYWPGRNEPPWSAQHGEKLYSEQAKLNNHIAFDSQGRKAIPHLCLSCHGGRLDPASGHVIGASLLPIVPARIGFGTAYNGQARAQQEEQIRSINRIVLESNPAPAIAAQIQTMYAGTVQVPGTRANDAAVPPGWRGSEGIYKQIVEPYCSSCHFAQRGTLSFASAADMRTHRDAVQRTVCTDFTMPHSEPLFRRFWTEGGIVSLPGLLSTWLGFNSCGS
jgi:hypothetical protein